MKKGDKWNWAFVMTGIILIAGDLYGRFINLIFYALYGFHHHTPTGPFPVLFVPLLFVFPGIAALYNKSSAPLIGTAIGLGMYYPISFLLAILWSFIPGALIDAVWPATGLVFLVLGIARKPRENQGVR